MKKVVFITLSVLLMLSANGCSKESPEVSQPAHEPTGANTPISMEHSWACTELLNGKSVMIDIDSQIFLLGDALLFAVDQDSALEGTVVYHLTDDTMTMLEHDGFPIGAVQEGDTSRVFFQDDGANYTMITYDSSFHEINSEDMTDSFSEISRDDGTFHAWYQISDGSQLIIDGAGNLQYYSPEGVFIGTIADGSIDKVIEADGKLYGVGSIGNTMVCEIDLEQLRTTKLSIPDMPEWSTGYYYGNDCFYLDNGRQLYSVNPSAKTADIVMDYKESDLDSSITKAVLLPDGEMLLAQRHSNGYTLYRARKRTQDEIDNMKLVSLAAFDANSTLSELIRRWNRQSDSMRIVVKSYFTYMGSMPTPEDRESAEKSFAQFKAELLNGIVPDIICTDNTNYAMLSNKGMFEDLRPWMENDPDFDQENYFMNFFEALSYRGAYEQVALTFSVSTAVAKTEYLNGMTSIPLKEYDQLAASLPEGMTMLPEHESRNSLLTFMALRQLNNFIDDEHAACQFNTEDFVKLLSLSARGAAEDYFTIDDYAWQENRVLLYPAFFSNFTEYHGIASVWFDDEPITLVGVPQANESSNGSFFMPGGTVAVSSNSLYKEEIWEFIKFALQEEEKLAQEQNPALYSFPVNKNAFHTLFDAEMQRDPESEPQTIIMNEDEYYVDHPVPEEEQILLNFVEGISGTYTYNQSVSTIVREEAEMYFSGDCTAEEAAEKIQGRVSLYLAEQS